MHTLNICSIWSILTETIKKFQYVFTVCYLIRVIIFLLKVFNFLFKDTMFKVNLNSNALRIYLWQVSSTVNLTDFWAKMSAQQTSGHGWVEAPWGPPLLPGPFLSGSVSCSAFWPPWTMQLCSTVPLDCDISALVPAMNGVSWNYKPVMANLLEMNAESAIQNLVYSQSTNTTINLHTEVLV